MKLCLLSGRKRRSDVSSCNVHLMGQRPRRVAPERRCSLNWLLHLTFCSPRMSVLSASRGDITGWFASCFLQSTVAWTAWNIKEDISCLLGHFGAGAVLLAVLRALNQKQRKLKDKRAQSLFTLWAHLTAHSSWAQFVSAAFVCGINPCVSVHAALLRGAQSELYYVLWLLLCPELQQQHIYLS